MAVRTVAPQADSALAEEPLEAPRLGSGRAKPRLEATHWRSRSPVRRLIRSPDPSPPLLPAADARKEGRGRGSAVVVVLAARSGEPAAKLVAPSASLSASSWGEEDGGVEPAFGSTADTREEGRGRGTATIVAPAARSGEPAPAKLATPSVSSSAPSWGEEDGGVEPVSESADEMRSSPANIANERGRERWLGRERGGRERE